MTLVDLTHIFDDAMPVYPGDPPARLTPIAFIPDHGYNDCCLHTGMHVGTHMDAPFHMIMGGAFMSDIAPEQFFGRGRLVDARDRAAITADLLDTVPLEAGDIVLVLTNWSKHFREAEYFENFPAIDPPFAQRLVEARVSILGLDTPSPDRPPFPVHKILLSQSILIIENLNDVDLLLGKDFDVTATPARFRCDAAPVRVIAKLRA
jgi:kynurenine formamidase